MSYRCLCTEKKSLKKKLANNKEAPHNRAYSPVISEFLINYAFTQ